MYAEFTKCRCTPLKISLPENETTVNLKSASFVVIMFLHEGLTHIQSQIKPRLLFGTRDDVMVAGYFNSQVKNKLYGPNR